ncbi:putative dullard-like phosphatase domain-containing protein [Colletotrichum sublineola]|uniref:Putative dullard-like phosphatase domain-containing protein n=1 Tax=Colletotrichum sublineola TaxID=1173701 RepID=A0A066Y0U0_COLSU|nr:putative dullard-like phosphatase domain-containing protein [Colletotrichum sublineola]
MNSLNIITSRVSPPPSPVASRSNSISSLGLAVQSDNQRGSENAEKHDDGDQDEETFPLEKSAFEQRNNTHGMDLASEATPLIGESKDSGLRSTTWHSLPRRIAAGFINSLRWVLSTLAAPGVYLIACLYDETGNFSPLFPFKRLFGFHGGNKKLATDYPDTMNEKSGRQGNAGYGGVAYSRPMGSSGSSSGVSSESESDADRHGRGSSSRHHRSTSASEEIAPARRSIRIKLHSDDTLPQRKHRKTQSAAARSKGNSESGSSDISAQLKSPTSPAGALTRYPKTPAPPRPLIPRRQPSYLNLEPSTDPKYQKTLILDLDETLIHSMSKGGRMSTGHMVEVRLNQTYVGAGGQTSIGPQHPILYWVNKRPHCDDFLRRVRNRRKMSKGYRSANVCVQVCKWYNLVVFTASVQEYADPVIDWLEAERKFFSARYYRQHCTFRQGAFIKDLSSVEPDLSKVMILDNSPLSYMFHQDNAIPIQGWINDPTDNDLLHLVPLLEGLQYVSDVRALLALRGGEDGQHMA